MIKIEIHEDHVCFNGIKYYNNEVLKLDEAQFFQMEIIDPHIYFVREIMKLRIRK